MANNNDIMQNPVRKIDVAFSANANTSDIIDLSLSEQKGYAQLRRISFLTGFVASNINFEVSNSGSFSATDTFTLDYVDGNDRATIVINGVSAGDSVSVPAPFFDSVIYFRVVSSTAQPISTNPLMTISATPIYDLGA